MRTALNPGTGPPCPSGRRLGPLMFRRAIGLGQTLRQRAQWQAAKCQRNGEFHNALPSPADQLRPGFKGRYPSASGTSKWQREPILLILRCNATKSWGRRREPSQIAPDWLADLTALGTPAAATAEIEGFFALSFSFATEVTGPSRFQACKEIGDASKLATDQVNGLTHIGLGPKCRPIRNRSQRQEHDEGTRTNSMMKRPVYMGRLNAGGKFAHGFAQSPILWSEPLTNKRA